MNLLCEHSADGESENQRPSKILVCFLASLLCSTLMIGITITGYCYLLYGKAADIDALVTDIVVWVLIIPPLVSLAITDQLCRTKFFKAMILRADALKGLAMGTVAGIALFCWILTIACLLQQVGFVSYNGLLPLFSTAGWCFGTGFMEEILFRGVLFTVLTKIYTTRVAVVTSTLIFGCLHFFVGGVVNIFTATAAGFLLCLIYFITRNLWIGIGIHGVWDFLCAETFSNHAPPVTGLFTVQVQPGFGYLDTTLELLLTGVIYFLWLTFREKQPSNEGFR